MPDILDLVEPGTLEQAPPRRLPPFFVPNLIGEYLLERPPRVYLNPLVLGCLLGAAVLTAIGAPPLFGLALVVLAGLRLLRPALRLYRDVREDYQLLREGVVVTAHVIGVRPFRDAAGNPAGAYLDCAVPLTRQRTSVGSVWVADVGEAMRLSALGRLTVICLPRAPGTWRLYRRPGAAVML
ncbi:MAG TPA: hypothetical protein PKD53_10280 [Chloroflexaceae bacterium]|nr:hypothetical protein [Chloroflexaceae bacterium]